MLTPYASSAAAQDLGLSGGSLQQQLADSEEERKKKLLAQAKAMQQSPGNAGGYGPSVQALFSGSAGGMSGY